MVGSSTLSITQPTKCQRVQEKVPKRDTDWSTPDNTHRPSRSPTTYRLLWVLGVLVAIALAQLSPHQRELFLDNYLQPIVDSASTLLDSAIDQPANNDQDYGNPYDERQPSPADSGQANGNSLAFTEPRQHTENHQIQCNLVATEPVRTRIKKVYRWQDDNGQWHYSDRQPQTGSTKSKVELDRVIRHTEQFSIQIETERSGVPAYLQDKIRRAATTLYQFLSAPLTPQQIRLSNIQVTLIGEQQLFSRHFNAVIQASGQQIKSNRLPAGFYSSRNNQAYVLTANRSPQQVQQTAIHESAHVIMAALYQQTPVWLNEGIAEFFEVSPESVIHTGYQPKPEWVEALKRSGSLPLSQLFGLSSAQWWAMKARHSYASAWVTVFQLMSSAEGKQALVRLLEQIKAQPCQPIDSLQLIDRYYPGGSGQLQREIQQRIASWE